MANDIGALRKELKLLDNTIKTDLEKIYDNISRFNKIKKEVERSDILDVITEKQMDKVIEIINRYK